MLCFVDTHRRSTNFLTETEELLGVEGRGGMEGEEGKETETKCKIN